mgnify:CR=1 FL=1
MIIALCLTVVPTFYLGYVKLFIQYSFTFYLNSINRILLINFLNYIIYIRVYLMDVGQTYILNKNGKFCLQESVKTIE